ncbi:MAG: DUF1611 domain-containing protein [Actinomycetia bacterium]|nr:DUF1611 domain-containing protein [Actinomycetes bacterium]
MLNRAVSAQLRSFAKDNNPIVLYTAGCLTGHTLTTMTEALLRHCPGRVIGVVDDKSDAESLTSIEAWSWAGPIPVVQNPFTLLAESPDGTDLVVGISLPGPEHLFKRHRAELVAVADAGHRVINGLNDTIDHPNIINLRAFTPDQRLKVTSLDPTAIRIAAVGTEPASPMLSTAIALSQALGQAGWTADWVPTSSAGVLIHGFGRPVDAAPVAFASNLLTDLIQTVEAVAEVVVVEGQGGLSEPADTALAAVITSTTSNRYHVLCHRPTAEEDLPAILANAADRYHALHQASGSPSTLLGVSLDTSALSEIEGRRSLDTARALGVPAVDWAKTVSPLATALSALTEEGRGP